jgi:septal ring factor EnvC (AmiA/AmiB activator)
VALAAPDSAPACALWEGIVLTLNERDAQYGKSLLLDHGAGCFSFYGNLGEIWVQEGQEINRGEYLGKLFPASKKDGTSYLHLEVIDAEGHINPLALLEGVARH